MKAKKMCFGVSEFQQRGGKVKMKKLILGLVMGVVVLLMAGSVNADWDRESIGGGSLWRHLQDVDDDGWVDSISRTHWFENPSGSGDWTSHSIGNADYPFAGCNRVGDVDGDGLPDLVLGVGRNYSSPDRNRVYAFINPGDTGTWDRYLIGTLPDASDGVETVAIGDMDNDGYPDILAGGECTLLRWYINPGYMTNNWDYYTVYNFARDVEGIVISDFDNDDYLDIAVTTCHPWGYSGGVYVLINPQAREGSWDRVTLDTGRRSCMETIRAGDIDGDGLNDVVFANRQPSRDTYLYWYENLGSGTSWSRHLIDTLSTSSLNGYVPEVADIDLDGLPDIICYHYDDNVTYWYGNLDGGDTWQKNTIWGGNITYWHGIGDVNNDGDIDIINNGYWYINPRYLEAGLKGCWHLDEGEETTAEDSSGYDNDADIYGAAWTTGKLGYGLDFDGANDYVDCGNDASLDITDAITIVAWVKPDTSGSNVIAHKRTANNRGWFLYMPSGGNFARFICAPGGTDKLASSSIELYDGEWHHVVGVYDGSHVLVYTDGVETVGASATGDIVYEAGVSAKIGDKSQYSDAYYFNGKIDEVRIYSRALSEDEIYEHYLEGIDNRGCWHLDEGEGTVASDSSGLGNDGDIYGATWATGKLGYGLDFDGENDYVDCGNDASLDVGSEDFTVGLWIKTNQTGVLKAPIGKKNTNSPYQGWMINVESDNSLQGAMRDSSSNAISLDPSENIVDGKWHHVVMKREGNTGYLYVDSVSSATDTNANLGRVDYNTNLIIGSGYANARYFNGKISEVRIYTKALSEDEIYEYYLEGIDNRRGCWYFDEGEGTTAEDSSGLGNDADIYGAAWATGKLGYGLDFDGANDYVDCGNDESLDITDAITIVAWVKPDTSGSNIIAHKRTANNRGWFLYMPSGGNFARFICAPGGTDKLASSSIQLCDGEWHHVVGVYDGSHVLVYTDGVETVGASATGDIVYEAGVSAKIGDKSQYSDAYYFNGKIDEVRIYSRALSADEIDDLYLE